MLPPNSGDKIMHASIRLGDSVVMASDGECRGGAAKFEGFSLSFTPNNVADADRIFAALADGGKITQPLTETFFASRFGMLADRFGMHWIIIAGSKHP